MKRLSDLIINSNIQKPIDDYFLYSPEYIGFESSDEIETVYKAIYNSLNNDEVILEFNPKRGDLQNLINNYRTLNGQVKPRYYVIKESDEYDEIIKQKYPDLEYYQITEYKPDEFTHNFIMVLNDINLYRDITLICEYLDRVIKSKKANIILVLPVDNKEILRYIVSNESVLDINITKINSNYLKIVL